MKKLQHFETEKGQILVEHPTTGKLIDFEGFWLLNDNLPCKNKQASPVAALTQLIDETIKFISVYTRRDILETLPEVQQELIESLYKVRDELTGMTDV